MGQFKNTGQHPVHLDDGRVLAPGEVVDLPDRDSDDDGGGGLLEHLVATGQLTAVQTTPDPAPAPQPDPQPAPVKTAAAAKKEQT
jgi:hypothetical protein